MSFSERNLEQKLAVLRLTNLMDGHKSATEPLEVRKFYKNFRIDLSKDSQQISQTQFERTGSARFTVADTIIQMQLGVDQNGRDVTTYQDVTDLANRALKDPLAPTFNRQAYKEKMANITIEIERDTGRRRNPISFGIILGDIDGLKPVNDGLGHPYGDLLIISIGQLFARTIREKDFVARIGGDEFVLLLSDLVQIDELNRVVRRIKDSTMSVGTLVKEFCHNQFRLLKSGGKKKAEILYKNYVDSLEHKDFLNRIPQVSIGAGILSAQTTENGRFINEKIKEIDALMYADKKARKKN